VTADDVRSRLATLRVHQSGGRRAPHKPLLLLYALGRFVAGVERLPFSKVESVLRGLLRDFGPLRAQYHAQYPFWRLQTSGLWTVHADGPLRTRASNTDPTRTSLHAANAVGQFTQETLACLRREPALVGEAAAMLLEAHFAPSLHDEIRTAVGLDLLASPATADPPAAPLRSPSRRRDAAFREAVLRAYGYRCAVCGFETRVGHALVGVDAAHLWWHGHGGPDDVRNGVALCALHHRLLDRGAFTLTRSAPAETRVETLVEVAEDAHGGDGFRRWLLDFHGQPIASPVQPADRVSEPAMTWHRREVFRGPARPTAR